MGSSPTAEGQAEWATAKSGWANKIAVLTYLSVARNEDAGAAGVLGRGQLLPGRCAGAPGVGQALHPGRGGSVIRVQAVRACGQHVDAGHCQRAGGGGERQSAVRGMPSDICHNANLVLCQH